MAAYGVVCTGCGAEVDPAQSWPFRCPDAVDGDDIDHVLRPFVIGDGVDLPLPGDQEPNPFVRYRRHLMAYHMAMAHGMSDDAYVALVRDLDDKVAAVDGARLSVTSLEASAALNKAAGHAIWYKNETGNVGQAHKSRHLMGVMIYLRILEELKLPAGINLRDRTLAIASCGNAAMTASIIAKAADWPLEVFVPDDVAPEVSARLASFGAKTTIATRQEGIAGDPCVHAFQRAVVKGAIPFTVQGNENGLAIDGNKTLGYEIAESIRDQKLSIDTLFIQVGGGALGSGCVQGLFDAREAHVIARMPKIVCVQTTGAYPLVKAFETFKACVAETDMDTAMGQAVRQRSRFMAPWPEAPHSVAHGILDDEVYDWLQLVETMAHTGGEAIVASEKNLEAAHAMARTATGLDLSHTGTAGLAGLLETGSKRTGNVLVLFTGTV